MEKYWRYYDKHIDCDWCGRQTRGRVYENRTDVTCGACKKQLKELDEQEIKEKEKFQKGENTNVKSRRI